MPEPLSDETLADYAERAEISDTWSNCRHGDIIRDMLAEVARLKAENAALRRELDAATAALEAQGQASFIAGMRTKAGDSGP